MELVLDRARIQEAWSAFWKDPASGQQCVRGAPEVTHALRTRWSEFAASLPPNARLLDLGCGAGAAANAIVAARRDLTVTGIDFARVPASTDTRILLRSDTPMESIPFADASFDAVTSQFGYEYSRTHKSANQLARVLTPGGKFSFIVHHAGSSVVATNRARLTMISTVLGKEMRGAFLSGTAFIVEAKLATLRRDNPNDKLIGELSRLLPMRARASTGERNAAWHALDTALSPERTILEAMDACCVAPEELDGWLGPLRQFCEVAPPSVLRKPNGDPIAWCIDGARR